jgi:hypothetical protein
VGEAALGGEATLAAAGGIAAGIELVAGLAADGAAAEVAAPEAAAACEPPAAGGAAAGGGGLHPLLAANATSTNHTWARMTSLIELKFSDVIVAMAIAARLYEPATGTGNISTGFSLACDHGRLASTHAR